MRNIVALALILFAPVATQSQPKAERQARLAWQAVPLDVARPDRRRVGRLIYLGGWSLRSGDPRFGGISAIHVEGRNALAVSDEGSLIRFALSGTGVSIRPLPAGPGASASKKNRDAESLVVAGDRAWIGFERANAIWAYRGPGFVPAGSAVPRAMGKWPNNGGAEAMLRLPDGRFLILSEEEKGRNGSTEALLFSGDPTLPTSRAVSLGFRAPAGFKVTDAAVLPDGRLLFLNRRYVKMEGVSAKLTIAPLSSLKTGGIIIPAEIAELSPPVTVDNMEALSVTREGGRTIVWIASDDNFSALQRTLLLKFALVA